MRNRVFNLIVVVVAYPVSAYAEVSGNIPSLWAAWAQAVVFGFVIYVAGSYRWWLGLPLMLFPVIVLLGTYRMQHDKFIGPAALAERGEIYFPLLYSADFLLLIIGIAGIVRGLQQRYKKRDNGAV